MKKLLTALALSSAINAVAYAQRPQTDRDFDGLKGPVKSLSVEKATLKRQGKRYVEERRVLTERMTYNADGNRANDEWYSDDDGVLLTKNAYRYAGGEKLADARAKDPVIHIPNSSETVGGGMRRFSEKYKYKYDERGRISEMTIERDRRVRLRVTYDHRNGQMEMRTYKDGVTLIYRRVDRFDARGNLVGSTDFDLDWDNRVDKSSYTKYEFDARGNWIKRLKKMSWGGEPEERELEYRTITYF